MWHQWFNSNIMKQQEYVFGIKNKKLLLYSTFSSLLRQTSKQDGSMTFTQISINITNGLMLWHVMFEGQPPSRLIILSFYTSYLWQCSQITCVWLSWSNFIQSLSLYLVLSLSISSSLSLSLSLSLSRPLSLSLSRPDRARERSRHADGLCSQSDLSSSYKSARW